METLFSDFDTHIMKRCFHLAKLAGKNVSSNPQVGAVIVYKNRVIGEGYHHYYGKAHAEVNAIENVKPHDLPYLVESTIYVSLEPCCHKGKTPACTDLLIKSGIKKVVISCLDANPKVSGRGVKVLRDNGVSVTFGLLEAEGFQLIKPFIVNLSKRPFITLKLAKSKDNFISKSNEQTWLTNDYSKVLSHQIRADNDAILVGNKTVLIDDPQLNTRLVPGDSPIRIVIDRNGNVPKSAKILTDGGRTIVVTEKTDIKYEESIQLNFDDNFLDNLLSKLFEMGISRLLVEGGAFTIKSFLAAKLWDKAFVFEASVKLGDGIAAPNIHGTKSREWKLLEDRILEISRVND